MTDGVATSPPTIAEGGGVEGTVAVVGCREFLAADSDWPLLRRALAGLDVRADLVAWDDSAVDWSAYPLVVLRSPWDHVTRPDDFRRWGRGVDAVSSLMNPLAMVEWNLDKRYLADLSGRGVITVPTQWVEPDTPWTPPSGEFVVKPSISGGGKDTARYQPAGSDDGTAAQRHVGRLQAEGRTVMVQPYLDSVDAEGELAMVFFAGRFSHAVGKGPLLRRGAGIVERLWETETLNPAVPSEEQREAAEIAVGCVTDRFGAPPIYCRVDLVRGSDDAPSVLEVELIDPSLFLELAPGSPERFAAVIASGGAWSA